VNDEDFARNAFAHAFRGTHTGEPDTLPNLDRITVQGRRATRTRRGMYAAGTTALAGAVTAGVVSGPSLLGLGSGGQNAVSAASGGGTSASAGKPAPTMGKPAPSTSSSPSGPDIVKPSAGVACATPPTLDWNAIVAGALPGTDLTPSHSMSCIEDPGGGRSIEVMFKLSSPAGDLQIDVGMGSDASASRTPTASASGQSGPNPLGKLEAIKSAQASSAQASADAAKSGAPSASPTGGSGVKMPTAPVCHDVGGGETACVSDLAKGGFRGTSVELFRPGAHKLLVQVIGTSGTTGSGTPATPTPPLTAAQLTTVAQAVATHF
jgi:hypothetical protein